MSKSEFKSLKELMDDELQKLDISRKFTQLEAFINDGKKSAEFIRSMLNDEAFEIPEESTDLYEIAEMRARHSAVTFLMGLVLKRFAGLFDAIPTIVDKEKDLAMQMWLMTSLYHDKAYSSEFIKRSNLDLEKQFSPYLLTDKYDNIKLKVLNEFSYKYPDSLAYTYQMILNYDKYAISYHKNRDSKEKRDHGILGGVMMFSELSKRAMKNGQDKEMPVIKACSLAVAQHNIFKAKPKYDNIYERFYLDILLSSSSFRIKQEKALLLFLSLVDTVECVKKFSKSQNSDKFLETLTTLKSIKMTINEKEIVLELSELSKRIKEKKDEELNKALEDYKKSLEGLSTWTEFNISKENDVFSIKLGKPTETLSGKVLVGAV